LAAGAARAEASELSWTDWTAGTGGLTSGSAIGTLPGTGVSYSGPFAHFDDGTGATAEDFSLAPDADGVPGIVVPGGPGGVVPTPVIQSAPEPATLILLGAGLTAIAMQQRRLQRRKQ
jgi:hypothetical protein